MDAEKLHEVLAKYGIHGALATPVTNGLINHTWKVTGAGGEYLLQQINHEVFKEPWKIAGNIRRIAGYLARHHPDYPFVAPVAALDGTDLVQLNGAWFRMFPFVSGGHSMDVVQQPAEAYEAAVQFGRFTRLLSGFDVQLLQPAIPHFHDLSMRFRQFQEALQQGNPRRIRDAAPWIAAAKEHGALVQQYEAIRKDPRFKMRVTHHDTKISNVLFDANGKGLCVIDLDTLMPGYFFSDLGDMMRTYLCPVSEEETDLSKIVVREEFYTAVVQGYYSEMKEELTAAEKEHFFYAGLFMTYMQALRFLTDHLNNDIYYGARYPGHNLNRAANQLVLLEALLQKKSSLRQP